MYAEVFVFVNPNYLMVICLYRYLIYHVNVNSMPIPESVIDFFSILNQPITVFSIYSALKIISDIVLKFNMCF